MNQLSVQHRDMAQHYPIKLVPLKQMSVFKIHPEVFELTKEKAQYFVSNKWTPLQIAGLYATTEHSVKRILQGLPTKMTRAEVVSDIAKPKKVTLRNKEEIDVSKKIRKYYYTPKPKKEKRKDTVNAIVNAVRERDKETCQMCGRVHIAAEGRSFNTHSIRKYGVIVKPGMSPDDFVLLCKSCVSILRYRNHRGEPIDFIPVRVIHTQPSEVLDVV